MIRKMLFKRFFIIIIIICIISFKMYFYNL